MDKILLIGIALGFLCITICTIIRVNYVRKIKPKVMKQKQIFETMNNSFVSKRNLKH